MVSTEKHKIAGDGSRARISVAGAELFGRGPDRLKQ
jgi:hypothetical protein